MPSLKSSLTRVLTTVIGGLCALAMVVLDNAIGSYPVFILLSLVGILLTLALCRLCRVPPISGRIGCITFILVVIVASGAGRIPYAVNRVIATAYGALVATAVAYIWDLVTKRIRK